MMRSCLLLLVIGCTATEPAMVTDINLTGSYHFGYGPISDDRTDVLFNSPTTVPQCCLAVWRRTTTSLELVIGNWVPDPAVAGCPPVAEARLTISGVVAGPQMIDLSPANTQLLLTYVDPEASARRCPHFAQWSDDDAAHPRVSITGQLKLDELHCRNEPDGFPCALVARGSWAVEGGDLHTSGKLAAGDTIGPLTF